MSQKSSKFVFVKETQLKNFVKNITPHVFYHLKIYPYKKNIKELCFLRAGRGV